MIRHGRVPGTARAARMGPMQNDGDPTARVGRLPRPALMLRERGARRLADAEGSYTCRICRKAMLAFSPGGAFFSCPRCGAHGDGLALVCAIVTGSTIVTLDSDVIAYATALLKRCAS